ncbi:hypothetical protein RB195_020871 [Necator americanus]|uniref:Uncharacterized protein n=1 Tax=Necator americanus TaxID=51031 RepID=A0ABR1CKY9_NECAM
MHPGLFEMIVLLIQASALTARDLDRNNRSSLERSHLGDRQQIRPIQADVSDFIAVDTTPGFEEVVASFLIYYDRLGAYVRNEATITVTMVWIGSIIEVNFNVRGDPRTPPFVIINNKKVCFGKCWADLKRAGDSLNVTFRDDNSTLIHINRVDLTRFTFTYDSCEQPLQNVQCRLRKYDRLTVCICNEGVDACVVPSPPLLNKEECTDYYESSTSSTSTLRTSTATTSKATSSGSIEKTSQDPLSTGSACPCFAGIIFGLLCYFLLSRV